MSARTKIEWTRGIDGSDGATWNPTLGCAPVSPGCDNCYAVRTVNRLAASPAPQVAAAAAGLVIRQPSGDLEWTGKVNLLPDRLRLPLRWRKSRMVFVDSQADLFHPDVPDEFIARVWAVMALTPQHIYQVLTKRHGRMRSLLASDQFETLVDRCVYDMGNSPCDSHATDQWPLPNVWGGVSVEDQPRAALRIPALLETPLAVRFLSCEPLIGPLDLSPWIYGKCWPDTTRGQGGIGGQMLVVDPSPLGWLIAGGESGPRARPMDLGWVRELRDQCAGADVPLFVKQLGSVWASHLDTDIKGGDPAAWPEDLRVRQFPETEKVYHA